MTDLTTSATIYARLAEPFDVTFKDVRGGVEITYITGEQCATRLNTVLGFDAWSTRVLEHSYNQEADEMWALVELSVTIDGRSIVRQHFGSQKVKRSRTTDAPLDIGFDLKGATTDALKKCASLIGVGLYLSHKEATGTPRQTRGEDRSAAQPPRDGQNATPPPSTGETYTCEQCDEELKELRFRDGTTWTPALLASYGRRKHNKVLCMQHYREANEARKKAEASGNQDLTSVPF